MHCTLQFAVNKYKSTVKMAKSIMVEETECREPVYYAFSIN